MTPASRSRPTLPGGVPNFDKFGFLPLGVASGRAAPDAGEGTRAASDALGRPVRYVDGEGYEREITAGATDPRRGAVAWVESRCETGENGHVDVEFRLRAEVGGRPAIDWVVETYNPYFGCRVGHLGWHGGRVAVVYREKHGTYACSLAPGGEKRLVEIAHGWLVTGSQVVYRSDRRDFVERLALPDLRPLDPVTAAEARAAGVLPPGYDKRNESSK